MRYLQFFIIIFSIFIAFLFNGLINKLLDNKKKLVKFELNCYFNLYIYLLNI